MTALLAEAEARADEDRRKRNQIERRNRAQTLLAQAERRLRDASLELGPYGAERSNGPLKWPCVTCRTASPTTTFRSLISV